MPTLEERFASRAQQRQQGVGTTPADVAVQGQMTLEDRFAQRAKQKQQPPVAQAAPITPPPGSTQAEKPGFLRQLYDATLRPIVENPGQTIGGMIGGTVGTAGYASLNPVVGVTTRATGAGLGGVIGQDIEDIIRTRVMGQSMTNTEALNRMFSAFLTQAAGQGGGELLVNAAKRFAARGSTSAAKWLEEYMNPQGQYGVVPSEEQLTQYTAGGPSQRRATELKLADIAADAPAREARIGAEQQQLPGRAVTARGQYGKALTEAEKAAQEDVTLSYGDYQKMLNKNTTKEPIGIKFDPNDSIDSVASPIKVSVGPVQAPTDIRLWREPLEAIGQAEDLRLIPEGSPIKTVLKRFLEKDADGEYVGNDVFPLDALKKDLNKMLRLVKNGSPETKRIANKIVDVLKPKIMEQTKVYARKTKGLTIKGVLKGRYAGDEAAMLKNLAYGKGAEATRQMNPRYVEAIGRYPKPKPPTTLLEVAKTAEDKSLNDFTDWALANSTNLTDYLKVVPGGSKDLLEHVIGRIHRGGDYKQWDALMQKDPSIPRMLTGNDPALLEAITEQMNIMKQVELQIGPEATKSFMATVLRLLAATKLGGPRRIRGLETMGANWLESPKVVNAMNNIMRKESSRLPTTKARFRGGLIARAGITPLPITPPPTTGENPNGD